MPGYLIKRYEKKTRIQGFDQSVPGVREAAIGFAKLGLQVLPIHHPVKMNGLTVCSCDNPQCTSIAKHPMTPHGWKDATDDLEAISGWFAENPDANIGVATGEVSGLVVLDIDPKNDGDRALEQLQDEHGMLPQTWTVDSGGGGIHFYFRYPKFDLPTSHGKLGPGVDVQSDGALVVAPHSLHASGKRYSFRKGLDPKSVELAALPEWLIDLLKDDAQHGPTPVQDWRDLVANGVKEGERNHTIARLTGHLLRKDVDPLIVLDLLQAWNKSRCRPPLPDSEVHSTINSIARRDLAKRMM